MFAALTSTAIAVVASSKMTQRDYTCTHAVYSPQSPVGGSAFCDFWYATQPNYADDELQLCECMQNNGKFCVSWLCANVANFDFYNNSRAGQQLSKLLLPSEVDLFGVYHCGYFTLKDELLLNEYCYKYNDWTSCFCTSWWWDPEADSDHCAEWQCHQFSNHIKSDVSIEDDYQSYKYDHDAYRTNSSDFSLLQSATKITEELYECSKVEDNAEELDDPIFNIQCVSWNGSVTFLNSTSWLDTRCNAVAWNEDSSIFTGDLPDDAGVAFEDLTETIVDQWQCLETVHVDAPTDFISIIPVFVGAAVVLLLCGAAVVYFCNMRKNKTARIQMEEIEENDDYEGMN